MTSSLLSSSVTTTTTSTTTISAAAVASCSSSSGCVAGTLPLADVIGHHGNVTSAARARKKSGVRSHAHSSLASDSSPVDMVCQNEYFERFLLQLFPSHSLIDSPIPTSVSQVRHVPFCRRRYKRCSVVVYGHPSVICLVCGLNILPLHALYIRNAL